MQLVFEGMDVHMKFEALGSASYLTNLCLLACAPPPPLVLEGLDVVMKVEALGSGSGAPSKKVTIADSGELKETS